MKTILYIKFSERQPSVQKCVGFSRGAQTHGWRVHTVTLPVCQPPDIKRLVDFWKADAFVFDSGGIQNQPDVRALGDMPSVFLTCRPTSSKRLFTVCEDLQGTAEAAARELLELGYRHFAFVHFPHPRYWSDERARHFRDIIRLHGGTYAEFAANDKASLLSWNRSLRRWIRDLPRPCGIFAANDEVSNQVRGICAAEGLNIPDDIALIGVDNDESVCTSVRPHLSSVLADNEQMGFIAAHLIAEQFKSASISPETRVVQPLMVIRRESTRRRQCFDGKIQQAVNLIREKACEGLRAYDVLKILNGARRTSELHFRRATGRSILEEIQRVRLERACELLSDQSRPVKVISNLCGYASESAFRKVYRARFGTSPRQTQATDCHESAYSDIRDNP